MLRKIFAQITAAVLLVSMSATAFAQTRVTFKRGKTSAVVAGTLPAGGERLYVVRGRAGQTLSVEVNSDKITVNLRRGEAETTEDIGENVAGMTADLQANGDYVFELGNASNRPVKFRMIVSIE